MFASANSAFSPIAQKGDATIVCSLQSLSLQMPRARARPHPLAMARFRAR